MSKIRALNRDIMSREEAKEVMKVYTATMSSLDDYEHQKVEEWGADVERSSQSKLKLPLLTRAKDAAGDSDVEAQLLSVRTRCVCQNCSFPMHVASHVYLAGQFRPCPCAPAARG